jgi:hypothetical protein
MISTSSDPTSFSNFRNSSGGDQLAVPYFQSGGTSGCIAVNVSDSGLSGLNDGSNVTLQMVFNGGDGILYQVCVLFFWKVFRAGSIDRWDNLFLTRVFFFWLDSAWI